MLEYDSVDFFSTTLPLIGIYITAFAILKVQHPFSYSYAFLIHSRRLAASDPFIGSWLKYSMLTLFCLQSWCSHTTAECTKAFRAVLLLETRVYCKS